LTSLVAAITSREGGFMTKFFLIAFSFSISAQAFFESFDVQSKSGLTCKAYIRHENADASAPIFLAMGGHNSQTWDTIETSLEGSSEAALKAGKIVFLAVDRPGVLPTSERKNLENPKFAFIEKTWLKHTQGDYAECEAEAIKNLRAKKFTGSLIFHGISEGGSRFFTLVQKLSNEKILGALLAIPVVAGWEELIKETKIFSDEQKKLLVKMLPAGKLADKIFMKATLFGTTYWSYLLKQPAPKDIVPKNEALFKNFPIAYFYGKKDELVVPKLIENFRNWNFSRGVDAYPWAFKEYDAPHKITAEMSKDISSSLETLLR
jgi:hypothetical protein